VIAATAVVTSDITTVSDQRHSDNKSVRLYGLAAALEILWHSAAAVLKTAA
jgi:hypothetical protein